MSNAILRAVCLPASQVANIIEAGSPPTCMQNLWMNREDNEHGGEM